MIQKKTILVVDDHRLFREGLKSILNADRRYRIIGESSNGNDALKMVKNLRPDLSLLDISLPDINGLQIIQDIKRLSEKTCIMIVSMHTKIEYIKKAFHAGATGYVTKDSAPERLIQGISSVLDGEYFIDSSISQKLVESVVKSPDKDIKVSDAAYGTLTPREQEIMTLLAEGFTTKQIGETLYISQKTVENHRSNIMNKLDLHSYHELVRYAARLGLIDVDLWKE